MASRLFQSAQHLRLARGKRSAKAGVEARSIIGKVKSVKTTISIVSEVQVELPIRGRHATPKKKAKIASDRLLSLTTVLKASLAQALEEKRKFEKGNNLIESIF
jgi:hypothetical protein